MNKTERNTILKAYKDIYYANIICNIDKEDSRREFKFLLDSLGLKKERYITENEVLADKMNLNHTQKQMFEMIFETFIKYDKYINYNLDEIECFYEYLKYKMTDEENKCYKSQINYLTSNQKVA